MGEPKRKMNEEELNRVAEESFAEVRDLTVAMYNKVIAMLEADSTPVGPKAAAALGAAERGVEDFRLGVFAIACLAAAESICRTIFDSPQDPMLQKLREAASDVAAAAHHQHPPTGCGDPDCLVCNLMSMVVQAKVQMDAPRFKDYPKLAGWPFTRKRDEACAPPGTVVQ